MATGKANMLATISKVYDNFKIPTRVTRFGNVCTMSWEYTAVKEVIPAAGITIGTLEAFYRPLRSHYISFTITGQSGELVANGRLTIGADGEVYLRPSKEISQSTIVFGNVVYMI